MGLAFSNVGGDLCLDFVNTVSWDRGSPAEDEQLEHYGDLLDWALEADLVNRSQHRRLLAEATGDSAAAARVLGEAWALRRTVYALFWGYAESGRPDPAALASFNRFLAATPVRLRLDGEDVVWDWSGGVDLRQIVWPVVWAAASLVRGEHVHQVKHCANDRCGWLFVDVSRRKNRKWCDMRDCGNRAKVRRHYARHKKAPGG